MSGKAKRKGLWISVPVMLIGLALAAAGVLLLRGVPSLCGYTLPAEVLAGAVEEPAEQLRQLGDSLEGIRYAGAVRLQGQTLRADNGESVSCTVYAVSEGWFDLRHYRLIDGRYVSGEDLRNRRQTVILSDRLAGAFFSGQESLDREISVAGKACRVIGVAEQGGMPGETDEYLAWIPLSVAEKEKMGGGTLEVFFGASLNEEKAVAKSMVSDWHPGGTWTDGARIRFTALMPLWICAVIAGLFLLRFLAGWILILIREKTSCFRAESRERYAGRMIGRGVRLFLLPGLLLLLTAGCFLGWLRLAVLPLYTYTDWIPEISVDPASVSTMIRGLAARSSAAVRCVTSASVIGEWSRALIAAGTVTFLAGLCFRLVYQKKCRTSPQN